MDALRACSAEKAGYCMFVGAAGVWLTLSGDAEREKEGFDGKTGVLIDCGCLGMTRWRDSAEIGMLRVSVDGGTE